MRLRLCGGRSYHWRSPHSQQVYHFRRRAAGIEITDGRDWEWLTSGTSARFDEEPVLGERLLGGGVSGSFDAAPAQRLLVCRGRGLGDVLLLIPALREWRRRYPESTVGVTVDRGYRRLFSGLGVVDDALDFQEAYTAAPWDVVVNLNYYAERSDDDTRLHRSEVFAHGLGLNTAGDLRLGYVVTDDDRARVDNRLRRGQRPLVVAQTHTSTEARDPSPEKIQEVLGALQRAGYRVAALGLTPHPVPDGVVNLQGCGMTLPDAAALLETADAVVGLDSGLTHLGNAVGANVIALFGPGEPALRVGGQPRCRPLQVHRWGGCDTPCRDYWRQQCKRRPRCLDEFPAELVVAAVGESLCQR